MNDFNITVKSEPFYAQDHYGAPVVIFDDIKLEHKILSTKIPAQAPMHVLKDVAAQQLAKKIVDSMNHTSISNKIENTYYDIFSFTYAEKDELDILKQQLKARTSDLESKTEQYNRTYNDLQKSEEYLKYITDKYMKAQKQVKFQYIVIGMLSASIVSFIISTLGAN